MLDRRDYVTKLNEELSYNNEKFSKEDVYNQFEKYVNNKQLLRETIEMGLFHYDYVKYVTLFEGTLYEDGIQVIVELCREAYNKNKEGFKGILTDSYSKISRGLENQTQLCWLEGTEFDFQRTDLTVKKVFRCIGDLVENTFKPHAFFLNNVRALVQDKIANQQKMGMVVDALINYHDVLKALYKDLLLGISISQWRNIADHGSYENTECGVKVTYGTNGEFNNVISIQDLKLLMCKLDTLLYMHKTAFTLLSVDYADILKEVSLYSKSKEDTWNDNLIAQTVETSYAYGLKVKAIENEESIWNIEVETDREQEKQSLAKYCSIIAKMLEDYRMTIYRNDKVEYIVQYMNGRLEIYKFKV